MRVPALSTLRRARRVLSCSQIRSLGAGGGPMQPEFGAQPPPTKSLPFDNDLIWHDSTAPETIIDFDATHVSSKQVYGSVLAVIGVLGSIYAYSYWSDPAGEAPVANLQYAAPAGQSAKDLGLTDYKYGDDEGEEEEH